MKKEIKMPTSFSANLINIILVAVLTLITGLLIYSMIHNKKE